MSAKEKREWPVVSVGRCDPADPSGDYFVLYPNEVSEYETETYHPESAPNVLSPAQARLLVDFLGRPCATESDRPAVKALRDRLDAFAKEQS